MFVKIFLNFNISHKQKLKWFFGNSCAELLEIHGKLENVQKKAFLS